MFLPLRLIAFAFAVPLMAESWSFSIDNDWVFGSDDKYSGGFQIGWMSDEIHESGKEGFAYMYANGLSELWEAVSPFDFGGMRRNGAISLQGVAITPEDTKIVEPIYDDVPYMGSTAITSSLYIWNDRVCHEALITLGVIGPASGADEVQKAIHRLLGITVPKGWDNQVGNRLLIQAGYVAGIRQYATRFANDYTFEWFNSLSVNAGSGFVGAGGGTALRIGENVPTNFITINGIVNRSLANQLVSGADRDAWGWSVNVGLFVDLIGYFYLYEYSKQHGYDYYQPPAVLTGRIGFDLYYKMFQASLELYPSRPIDEYVRSNYYGRLNLVFYVPE